MYYEIEKVFMNAYSQYSNHIYQLFSITAVITNYIENQTTISISKLNIKKLGSCVILKPKTSH